MAPKPSKRKITSTVLGYILFGFVIPSVLLAIGGPLYFVVGLSLSMTAIILVSIVGAGILVAGIVYAILQFKKNNSHPLKPEDTPVVKSPTRKKSPKPEPEPKPDIESESRPEPEPEQAATQKPLDHGPMFQDITTVSQGVLTIKGHVNKQNFEQRCLEMGVTPSTVVFIFPGNKGHHCQGQSLFSVKSGGRLAAAAQELGEAGYATLSLPTTDMDEWGTDDEINMIVRNAIADLYKAAGAKFSLMLPIRSHKKSRYFEASLSFVPGQEPSFWGGVITTPNPKLAKYYLEALEVLDKFLKASEAEKQSSPFYEAYGEGQKLTGKKNFSVLTCAPTTTRSSKPR